MNKAKNSSRHIMIIRWKCDNNLSTIQICSMFARAFSLFKIGQHLYICQCHMDERIVVMSPCSAVIYDYVYYII